MQRRRCGAAVDKEADMVDEPFGGSSTEVARLSCRSLKPILSDRQLSLATFVTHNPFLPLAGARNSQFLGVTTGNFSGGTGNPERVPFLAPFSKINTGIWDPTTLPPERLRLGNVVGSKGRGIPKRALGSAGGSHELGRHTRKGTHKKFARTIRVLA
eukprot:scaffold32486_cov66-Cyclotella_meneghiniana.AAC.5